MKKNMFILSIAALLVACTGGTSINNNGTPTGELYWPDVERVSFEHGKGTFVNLENLSKARPGLSRDDMYDLFGRPHFAEGFHVREWTYLFYFNTPGYGTDGVSSCQYKILFDDRYLAQSYHWHPVDPVDGHCPPLSEKQATYRLDADALFAFDRSDLAAVNTRGRQALNNLAEELKTFGEIKEIEVKGYTDYLGDSAYNDALSQRRAETVSEYLISLGVKPEVIKAKGYGETKPVVTDCSSSSRGHASLVECLAPNRRVEIDVDGYGIR